MLGIGLVIAAAFLWAIDTLIRYPLMGEGISAYSIVLYEHIFLSVLFGILFFKSLKKLLTSNYKIILYFIVIGGFGSAIATLAFTRAFSFLNPSLVILLQKFQPIVAILLAAFILKEKVVKQFIFWAAICLAGALLISYEDLINIFNTKGDLGNLLFHDNAFTGYALVAVSVVGWASSTVFGKKLSLSGVSNEEIMTGRFLVGLICLLPFLGMGADVFTHSVEIYGKVSLMVVISGVLAMYLYYRGLSKISARSCTLAEMFFPFFAVVVNWIFLDKSLSPIQLAGGGLLLLGSSMIQVRKL